MTSKNHHVVDLGLWLTDADSDADVDGVSTLAGHGAGALGRWDMLCLSPNARWTAPDASSETTVLVLEGVATFNIDDWRYSSATGHLLVAPPGSEISAVNDGTCVMRALVCTISSDDDA